MSNILRIQERIKKNQESDCWIWTGHIQNSGYGMITINKKNFLAHRLSYEAFIGKIPKGINVCHKCDVKLCCNPEHLFLGTQKENIADCIKKGRHLSPGSGKVVCKNGHGFTEENTYLWKGHRQCKLCKRTRSINSRLYKNRE